jgi:hypothetical protein
MLSVTSRHTAALASRLNAGDRRPAPTARRTTTVTSIRSANGYAIPTSFWSSVDWLSAAVGDIRKTHETTPIPIATISESMKLSRSRPGLRLRTSQSSPAIRQG